MASDFDHLDEALERIRSECVLVRRERERFEEFRESVRLTPPASETTSNTATRTGDLGDEFRNTVVSTSDFEETYVGSVEEHLKQEFSHSIGEALLSDEQFTQRLKRKLLVQSSRAIERRNRLEQQLTDEEESVEAARSELCAIQSELEVLPEPTVEQRTIESLLDTWEAYDRLEARCESLLDERQQYFSTVDQVYPMENASRTFNEYLYADLGKEYPVLSAIGSTLESVVNAKGATIIGRRTSSRA